jgi:thiosulfate/3-mercaptopyruvate sulfurtransferase
MSIYPLISAQDAVGLAQDEKTVFFDATAHLPDTGRDAEAEFLSAHIPGAQRFDINEIALPDSGLPHTMPTSQLFQRHMQMRGVNAGSHILIYDDSAVRSAARAWFMLRYFGHDKVQVIDGGITAWRTAGGTTAAGEATPPARGDFIASDPVGTEGMISVHSLKRLVDKPLGERNRNILDARPEGRFLGRDPEPRPGLAGGHMPGAINIPYNRLFDPETGCYRSVDEIRDVFADIDTDKGVITTCGSGITACVLILGLTLIGRDDLTLYDGSWAEWGSREDCPVSV